MSVSNTSTSGARLVETKRGDGTFVEYPIKTVRKLLRPLGDITNLVKAVEVVLNTKYETTGTEDKDKAETKFGKALQETIQNHYDDHAPHLLFEDTHKDNNTLAWTGNFSCSKKPDAVKRYKPNGEPENTKDSIALLLEYKMKNSGNKGISQVLQQANDFFNNLTSKRAFIDCCLVEKESHTVHFLRISSCISRPTIHVKVSDREGVELFAMALLACPYAAHCMPLTPHREIVSFPPCGSYGWMIKINLKALAKRRVGNEDAVNNSIPPEKDTLYVKYIVRPSVDDGEREVTTTAADLAKRESAFQNCAATYRDALVGERVGGLGFNDLAAVIRTVDLDESWFNGQSLRAALTGDRLLLDIDLSECVITYGHGERITENELIRAEFNRVDRLITNVHSLSGHYESILRTAVLVFRPLGFMHGDLRLANIFVRRDDNGSVTSVAIGDFGVATHFGDPRGRDLRLKYLPDDDLAKHLNKTEFFNYLYECGLLEPPHVTEESVAHISGKNSKSAVDYLRIHPEEVVSDRLRTLLDTVVRSSAEMEEGSLLRIVYAAVAHISSDLSVDEKAGPQKLMNAWNAQRESLLYKSLQNRFVQLKNEARELRLPNLRILEVLKGSLEPLRVEKVEGSGVGTDGGGQYQPLDAAFTTTTTTTTAAAVAAATTTTTTATPTTSAAATTTAAASAATKPANTPAFAIPTVKRKAGSADEEDGDDDEDGSSQQANDETKAPRAKRPRT